MGDVEVVDEERREEKRKVKEEKRREKWRKEKRRWEERIKEESEVEKGKEKRGEKKSIIRRLITQCVSSITCMNTWPHILYPPFFYCYSKHSSNSSIHFKNTILIIITTGHSCRFFVSFPRNTLYSTMLQLNYSLDDNASYIYFIFISCSLA